MINFYSGAPTPIAPRPDWVIWYYSGIEDQNLTKDFLELPGPFDSNGIDLFFAQIAHTVSG